MNANLNRRDILIKRFLNLENSAFEKVKDIKHWFFFFILVLTFLSFAKGDIGALYAEKELSIDFYT